MTSSDATAALHARLDRMERVLAVLCLCWIAVVGWHVFTGVGEEDLGHHATPPMQERMKACEGEYAQRYQCKQDILINGDRSGLILVLERLSVTFGLPGVAWSVWLMLRRRTERLAGENSR